MAIFDPVSSADLASGAGLARASGERKSRVLRIMGEEAARERMQNIADLSRKRKRQIFADIAGTAGAAIPLAAPQLGAALGLDKETTRLLAPYLSRLASAPFGGASEEVLGLGDLATGISQRRAFDAGEPTRLTTSSRVGRFEIPGVRRLRPEHRRFRLPD